MANTIAGTRILNLGGRAAVNICAGLLRRAGATVEDGGLPAADGRHDVVLFSSDDIGPDECAQLTSALTGAILCDIATTYRGTKGAEALGDAVLQARSGLMDVTGFAGGPPTATVLPIIELSGALYAASLVSALRLAGDKGADVSISLLGCAISTLTTFLPQAFVGGRAGRIGNRHPACSPWNAYPTRDGNVLVCTSSNEQWLRLRARVNRPDFLDPRFDNLDGRLAAVDEIDRLMGAWTGTLTTAECLVHCEAVGIPAGPIVAPDRLWQEPNFRFRHPEAAAAQEKGAPSGAVAALVGLLRTEPLAPQEANKVAGGNIERIGGRLPLAGLRVLELGQYTTVPLATRHLAALGADVLKIEPPSGEVTRRWQPAREGMSYYFVITNAGKTIEFLDLSQDTGCARLAELVGTAHVLIENMRPGALAKRGFDRARLAALNPALVYCGVSGFGAHSAYPGRPAFDTVVQGMAGFMELTQSGGQPVKLGVSAADILGAQCVLYAVLTSLPRTGQFIDVAMQDIAAWSSILAGSHPSGAGTVLPCLDGALWLERETGAPKPSGSAALQSLPRALAQTCLAAAGVKAHSVARVDELLLDPQVQADALAIAIEEDGAMCPILMPPYRIASRPLAAPKIPRRLEPAANA
jgi:crotonobetainyl-CoA:carnitine CoA-transferase CaiB-like acyl-CoA transferase